jgi:integrase
MTARRCDMTGSVIGQVQALFRISGIKAIRKSRHKLKQRARAAGARTSGDIAALCPVTGYMTLDKYREVAILFGRWITEEFGCRWDIEATTADNVWYFLMDCIDRGVALRTWRTYASALNKLALALTRYAQKTGSGRTYDFRSAIDSLRPVAAAELELDRETREYLDPAGLVADIEDVRCRVAAAVQNEGGARIRETGLIRAGQLLGTGVDDITRRPIGKIFLPSVATKGGRTRTINVTIPTYSDLSGIIAREGELRIDHDGYRRILAKAARATSQRYTGSHGLRYCFAQRRLAECLASGMGQVAAMLRVAQEMGHCRPGITLTYVSRAG